MTTTYTVVDITPDTPEWEQERRNSIGASDVPNLLLMPGAWGTPLEVYQSKIGVDKHFDPLLGFIGHALESVMQQWLEWAHPNLGPIGPAIMARHTDTPWIHASFDRFAGDGAPIQMKSVDYFIGGDWDTNTPLHVQAQIQTEIYVAGTDHGWAVAFIGGKRFVLYRIERDQEFIDMMLPRVKRFWVDHVQARKAPMPMNPGEAAWLWPSKGTPLIVSDPEQAERLWDLHGVWRDMQDEKTDLSGRIDALKLELQTAMQECDEIRVNGKVLFSWRANKKNVRVFLRHKIAEAGK